MIEAAEEVKILKGVADNSNVADVGVSCDGTWRKKGFQSNNGVFAALSMDDGKVLDVEAMGKYCIGGLPLNPSRSI